MKKTNFPIKWRGVNPPPPPPLFTLPWIRHGTLLHNFSSIIVKVNKSYMTISQDSTSSKLDLSFSFNYAQKLTKFPKRWVKTWTPLTTPLETLGILVCNTHIFHILANTHICMQHSHFSNCITI